MYTEEGEKRMESSNGRRGYGYLLETVSKVKRKNYTELVRKVEQ